MLIKLIKLHKAKNIRNQVRQVDTTNSQLEMRTAGGHTIIVIKRPKNATNITLSAHSGTTRAKLKNLKFVKARALQSSQREILEPIGHGQRSREEIRKAVLAIKSDSIKIRK